MPPQSKCFQYRVSINLGSPCCCGLLMVLLFHIRTVLQLAVLQMVPAPAAKCTASALMPPWQQMRLTQYIFDGSTSD
jgi:hypothetical protein